MYTTQELPVPLHTRLSELEQELGVPIRALHRRPSSPWTAEQVSDPDAVAHAQEHGITIALYSVPDNAQNYQDVVRVATRDTSRYHEYWDVRQPAATPTFPIEVTTDRGNPALIGEVQPRTVYDFIGVARDVYAPVTPVFDALAEAVRLSADVEFIANYMIRQREVERESLVTFARQSYDNQINSRRQQIDTHQLMIIEHQTLIAQGVRGVQRDQELLDALLLVQSNDGGERMISEWDLLTEHPRVAELSFTNGLIKIVTTDDLRLHHPITGETRWLGAFEVDVNAASLEVTLRNLNTTRGGRDHPHVVGGQPCFGGHDVAFHKLLGQGELYTMFELLLQYLENLNIHDEYGRYGSYWFDVPDERPLVTEDAQVEEAVAA